MLIKLFRSLTLTAVGLLACTVPMQAQKKSESTVEQVQQDRMRQLMVAYDLAAQGQRQNAPEYLIAAAGMLRDLATLKDLATLQKFDAKVEISGPGDPLDKELPTPSLAKQSDELFRRASDMGASLGVNVDKLIDLAKKRADEAERNRPEEERDVIGGPKVIDRTIGAGQTHSLRVTIKGNQKAQFMTHFGFQSSAAMHLSIVHDGPDSVWANGNTWNYHASWRPQKDCVLVIRVQNKHKKAGQYQMLIQ